MRKTNKKLMIHDEVVSEVMTEFCEWGWPGIRLLDARQLEVETGISTK